MNRLSWVNDILLAHINCLTISGKNLGNQGKPVFQACTELHVGKKENPPYLLDDGIIT